MRGVKLMLPPPDGLEPFFTFLEMAAGFGFNTIMLEIGGAMEYKTHPEINEGWIEYAGAHRPRTKCVYLSLGDREEKAKNRILATVGSCIRTQAALLETAGIDCVLEWNEGNHFRDAGPRTAKAFAWVMRQESL